MAEPDARHADGAFEPFDTAIVPVQHASKGTRFALSYQHLSRFGGGSQVGVALEVQGFRQSQARGYWEGVDVDAAP
jgi:hypothetical protein